MQKQEEQLAEPGLMCNTYCLDIIPRVKRKKVDLRLKALCCRLDFFAPIREYFIFTFQTCFVEH